MRIDVSIVSFLLVLVIAIPVTALRSQTYSVGYEIASLKAKERQLRDTNLELQAKLARTEAQLTDIPPVAGKWTLPRIGDISSLDK
jgi:hypothetical protein